MRKSLKTGGLILATLILSSFVVLFGQIKPVSFDEVNRLPKGDERMVMVLIGIQWCRYCHSLKQVILKDKTLTNTLKEPVYAVVLDAEEKKDIHFANRRFKYKPNGVNTGVHELAEELGTMNGQLTYPSLCFLNEKNEIIFQHEGYLNAASLAILLKKLTSLQHESPDD